MKYIRYKDYGMCLFSNIFKHKTIANCFYSYGIKKIISAGFVGVGIDGKLDCYGESTSLGIHSLYEEDSEILRKQF